MISSAVQPPERLSLTLAISHMISAIISRLQLRKEQELNQAELSRSSSILASIAVRSRLMHGAKTCAINGLIRG